MFSDENRELTRDEYRRLVRAAEQADHRRLSLVIQTMSPSRFTGHKKACKY